MERKTLLKTIFLLFVTLSFINGLYAQETVNENKIKVRGTSKTELIHCKGEKLIISGNRHKITVTGYCFEIAVYGNECLINLESVRLITLHGNNNKITYKANPEIETKVSRFGDYNKVNKTEFDNIK